MPESPVDKTMLAQAQTRLPLNGLKVLDLTLARAQPIWLAEVSTGWAWRAAGR